MHSNHVVVNQVSPVPLPVWTLCLLSFGLQSLSVVHALSRSFQCSVARRSAAGRSGSTVLCQLDHQQSTTAVSSPDLALIATSETETVLFVAIRAKSGLLTVDCLCDCWWSSWLCCQLASDVAQIVLLNTSKCELIGKRDLLVRNQLL